MALKSPDMQGDNFVFDVFCTGIRTTSSGGMDFSRACNFRRPCYQEALLLLSSVRVALFFCCIVCLLIIASSAFSVEPSKSFVVPRSVHRCNCTTLKRSFWVNLARIDRRYLWPGKSNCKDITSYFRGFVPILVYALFPRVWMNQEVTRDTDLPGCGDNCRASTCYFCEFLPMPACLLAVKVG